MKKIFTLLILAILLFAFVGCHDHTYSSDWSMDADKHWHEATCHAGEKTDLADHEFKVSDELDENGNAIYACVSCGFKHQHVYDGGKWEYNGREHWHPVSCGHEDAPLYKEEHVFEDEQSKCSLCGCDEETAKGYEIVFAYYLIDENGNPIVDEETGAYSEVGVTYTSVEKDGSSSIDTVNGGYLYEGDKISFTVKKSIFCYYTDGSNKPYVEIVSGKAEGEKTREAVEPDANGVYTVTVKGDTIISVANVATSPSTIDGKGTKEEPFSIKSEVDWLYFALYINSSSLLEYNIGYWRLDADLDFQGESIYVIGDGFTTANSVFCGNFDGGGHTISNFVLDNAVASSVGEGYSNYLGLFGVVTGYVGVDSVIANLTVENVTVNAVAGNNDIVSAGAILGYGVGANVRNCTVRNSQINVSADDLYMSFAGGAIGYLQSGMTEQGILFYSSASYLVADNVTISGSGMLYSAGGIVGRVVSYSDQVTSFVLNCHSSGSISDAVRAGGIVGDLLRYGSIQNSYSTATVSAYASFKAAVDAEFDGTAYDDRYAYAGGVVGYVENDTAIEGCFFDGSTYATAVAGKNYAKNGEILAGFSADKFADYYAKSVILNNYTGSDKITGDELKNTFGWSEADWVFGDGYPTINQNEAAHVFTLTVNIDGENFDAIEIDSQYIPLSYWYIIEGSSSSIQALPPSYRQGTKRTYGYYFDSACTKSVPVGYVPMRDMTVYAKFADTATIEGDYHLSNNGVIAKLSIKSDGTYTYEEGAILLNGKYLFDGEIITLSNSFFSRMAATATAAQRAYYYTFWARIQQNDDLHVDLHIFDCDEQYIVSAENEAQNASFTAMARFYPESSPLVAVSASNLSFTGGYYYVDGEVKHVFEFNNDYTGSYTKYIGESVSTDGFTFEVGSDSSLIISLNKNGTQYVANVESGSITDNREAQFELKQIDGFAGAWEKEATSHKIYTFDGMGNWTYEHYVYLVDENLVNASKEVVSTDSGEYEISGGELTFMRDGISVVATLKNGAISITEDGQPVEVEFTGANGFKGVWYTANNKIIRYTLTLNGLNAQNVGTATLSGFEIEPLQLRYTAVSSDTLYLYVEDVVYAVLRYSPRSGLFEGMFYSSETNSPTTSQTLYLYDDFLGSWVSDIEGIPSIKFNGFGAYDTKDASGDNLAVKGSATIGSDTVNYVLVKSLESKPTADRKNDSAQFTYKNVTYTLSYNEYADTISVSYGNGMSGTIAKADVYADVVFIDGQTTYAFDGRGNFAQGGTVVSNGVSGKYFIQSNGDVLIKFEGQSDKTIVVNKEGDSIVGYSIDGRDLYVDNPFLGNWVVPYRGSSPNQNGVLITVGNLKLIPSVGQTVAIEGSFYGEENVTMFLDGVDVLRFTTQNGSEYQLLNVLGGKVSAMVLTETVTIETAVTTKTFAVRPDEFMGIWTRTDTVTKPVYQQVRMIFDGRGGSPYLADGELIVRPSASSEGYVYKIVNGVVNIYEVKTDDAGVVIKTLYATFVECDQADEGAYVKDGKYFKLNLV